MLTVFHFVNTAGWSSTTFLVKKNSNTNLKLFYKNNCFLSFGDSSIQ